MWKKEGNGYVLKRKPMLWHWGVLYGLAKIVDGVVCVVTLGHVLPCFDLPLLERRIDGLLKQLPVEEE